ncbi:MAG: hypothetical protein GX978_01235 [Tissierellia bacterium]|jgi:hypothetical protein|nr:hypothetical protein [Tissierellia bacterium]
MNYEKYLYIDYENVQDVQTDAIDETMRVMIVVGVNQTKVPLQLVQQTQRLGEQVQWIQVGGQGRDALDFFIAYYVGRDVCLRPENEYIIYSKDAGYDPLIDHLKNEKVNISRIVSFQELLPRINSAVDKALLEKTIQNLTKVAPNKRPKKRHTLTKHVAALFPTKPTIEIEGLIEQLFIDKLVYEQNGLIRYDLEKLPPRNKKK